MGHSPIVSSIWILDPQLVVLFGETQEARPYWRKLVTRGRLGKFSSDSLHSDFGSLCLMLLVQDVSPQPAAPASMLLPRDGLPHPEL